MIYYFSGTGNSMAVAAMLGKELEEEARIVSSLHASSEELKGESVGFVFPVYSWGVPPIILDFIKDLPEKFWLKVRNESVPVWCVMTCGDEVAMAPEMFIKALKRRSITPQTIRSVIMPNDYVLLPGFDVDSREVEKDKLSKFPKRVAEIAGCIKRGESGIDVVRGSMPRLKTSLVYPLFKRWGISPGKWHSTEMCVGCGICVKNCPLKNIAMNEHHRPEWGENCSSCLGCYHSCPHHAVAYGNSTKGKGQYFFPKIKD
ncbi:MAG: EFR1 family ferrodoxin [Muribaculaceae bacterium]|nr:EFR1 family ferrodoxin [Muribaculaceae bacterium]